MVSARTRNTTNIGMSVVLANNVAIMGDKRSICWVTDIY